MARRLTAKSHHALILEADADDRGVAPIRNPAPPRSRPTPGAAGSSCFAPTPAPRTRSGAALPRPSGRRGYKDRKSASRHPADLPPDRRRHPEPFLALVLRHELVSRLALGGPRRPSGSKSSTTSPISATSRSSRTASAPACEPTGPRVDADCRAVGITLPPVYQEIPPAA